MKYIQQKQEVIDLAIEAGILPAWRNFLEDFLSDSMSDDSEMWTLWKFALDMNSQELVRKVLVQYAKEQGGHDIDMVEAYGNEVAFDEDSDIDDILWNMGNDFIGIYSSEQEFLDEQLRLGNNYASCHTYYYNNGFAFYHAC